MADNTTPLNASAAQLVVKHRKEIDRIANLPGGEQMAAMMQYGIDPKTMVTPEMQKKGEEIDASARGAAKKSLFTGLAAFLGTLGITFFTRKKVADGKILRSLYVIGSSVATAIGGSWIAGRIFGKKVLAKLKSFDEETRTEFEQRLAMAIEKTQQAAATAASAEPDPAVQVTRKNLSGMIGNGAVECGLITTAQRDRALEIQARFLALANTGQRLEAGHGWDVLDDAKWQQTAAAKQIGEPQMQAARSVVMQGKGLPKEQSPAFGDVIVAAGFVSPQAKSAYLMAQAAERTIECLAPDTNITLADVITQHKWQRIGTPGDSAQLQGAQSVNYLSALLGAAAREAGIPDNQRDKIENARSALATLSMSAFEQASKTLAETPATQPLAARIDAVDKYIAVKTGKNAGISREEAQRALSIVQAGLAVAEPYANAQLGKQNLKWPAEAVTARVSLVANAYGAAPASGLGTGRAA